LVHFHGDRDWFECHEILEEYWKSNPDDTRNRTWVGLIQIAVGLYHERRGNTIGAVKMLNSAVQNLQADALSSLGLDAELTLMRVQERADLVQLAENQVSFQDLNLPITDKLLLDRCLELCNELGLIWEATSMLEDRMLIHKHTLRDRSEVIAARQEQARLRRKGS
jgi:predicted metal-dependent hydrolase